MPRGVHFISDDDDETDSDSLLTGTPSPVFTRNVKKRAKIAPWIAHSDLDSEPDLFSPAIPPKRFKTGAAAATLKSPGKKSPEKLKQVLHQKDEWQELQKKTNRSPARASTSNGPSHSKHKGVRKMKMSQEKSKLSQERRNHVDRSVNGVVEVDEQPDGEFDQASQRLRTTSMTNIFDITYSDSDIDEFDVKPPTWRVTSQCEQAHSSSPTLALPQPNRPPQKTTSASSTKAATARSRRDCSPEVGDSLIVISDSVTDDNTDSSPDISDEEFGRIIRGLQEKRQARAKSSSSSQNHSTSSAVAPTMTSVETSSSAATTSTAGTASSSISSFRHKKNSTGHKGKTRASRHVTEFVPASELDFESMTVTSPCSPSVECRRLCPCKGSSAKASSTISRPSPKKRPVRSSSTGNQGSSINSSTPGAAASGINESMVQAIGLVTQMEKDEEMARKLQEDLDRQYAATLASCASPTPRPRRPNTPRMLGANALGTAGHMEARINMLSDWEWQVHVALVQGSAVPPTPPGNYRQNPDGPVDSTLLEYLFTTPDALNWRHTTNNRQSPASQELTEPEENELLPMSLEEVDGLPHTCTRSGRRRAPATRRGRRSRSFNRRINSLIEDRRLLMDELHGYLFGGLLGPGGAGLNATFANGENYEDLLALDNQLEKVGLSTEQISRLPITTFKEGSVPPTADGANCHVCMSDYEDGDRLRILTCFHSFHCDCIDQWIKDNPTCPVCRNEVKV